MHKMELFLPKLDVESSVNPGSFLANRPKVSPVWGQLDLDRPGDGALPVVSPLSARTPANNDPPSLYLSFEVPRASSGPPPPPPLCRLPPGHWLRGTPAGTPPTSGWCTSPPWTTSMARADRQSRQPHQPHQAPHLHCHLPLCSLTCHCRESLFGTCFPPRYSGLAGDSSGL